MVFWVIKLDSLFSRVADELLDDSVSSFFDAGRGF